MGQKLEGWLIKQLKLAQPTLATTSPYARMGAFINARAQRSLQRLGNARKRLAEMISVVKTGRSKRGIFDGVGQGFKWLFGVATSSDLMAISDRVDGLSKNQEDIVHLMDHQATITNETLWEVRQTSVVISNLTTALFAVDRKVKEMYSQLEVRWRWSEDALNLYLEVDDLFNEIDTVLSGWEEQLNELELGFSTLATG